MIYLFQNNYGMEWRGRDMTFCREVLLMEPYEFKIRSRDRGKIWKDIAEHLNSSSSEDLFLKLTLDLYVKS